MTNENNNKETYKEIRLTYHANKRMHERAGLNKKAGRRKAKIALERGISPEQTRGPLRRYLTNKQECALDNRVFFRIYGELLFIFKEDGDRMVLITVYQVPQNVRKMANKCQTRLRQVA